jgi:tetratricopeptide (TPR) repeat protein
LLRRFYDAIEPTISARVTRALWAKARLLLLSGNPGDAITVSDALLRRLEGESATESPAYAGALLIRGQALLIDGRKEDAIEAFDALASGFEDAPEATLRQQAALALSNKSMALVRLGRIDEAHEVQRRLVSKLGNDAIVAFDEIATQSRQTSNPISRESAATALLQKAFVLVQLDRRTDSATTVAEMIDQFENDENPTIQHLVARARELVDASDGHRSEQ